MKWNNKSLGSRLNDSNSGNFSGCGELRAHFRGTEVAFIALIFLCALARAGSGDHEDHLPGTSETNPKRAEQPQGNEMSSQCGVSPQQIAEFANGDSYNYHSMVTFLTQPECQEAAPALTRAAEGLGIKFSSTGPYRLESYATSVPPTEADGRQRISVLLSKEVPVWLRDSPLSPSEILPVIGQLAILSRPAARFSLANLIGMRLYDKDPGILDPKSSKFGPAAKELAKMLTTLGANEPVIAANLADSVEDMAVLAQADSLGKIFRGLATAAAVDATLAPAFTLSAGALNRGVRKGKKLYGRDSQKSMLLAVFRAVQASVAGSESLEAGSRELNEALRALIKGLPLRLTILKKLYREALQIVAESPAQSALADALALSLTPDFVFLPARDMAFLFHAARTYPSLAAALQSNFLHAWNDHWNRVQDGDLKITQFNRTKTKIFEPILLGLLDLGPTLVDPTWLKSILAKGLVTDEQIEKRFPRFLLVFLEQQERVAQVASRDVNLGTMVASMAEDFRVLWTVSTVHVPALMKWVQRYDQ